MSLQLAENYVVQQSRLVKLFNIQRAGRVWRKGAQKGPGGGGGTPFLVSVRAAGSHRGVDGIRRFWGAD